MKPNPTQKTEALSVALRVRPMNSTEIKLGAKQIAFAVDNNLVVLMDPNDDSDDVLRANRSREKKYMFDCAFDGHDTQEDIYNCTVKAKKIVDRVLDGYNCTVFAYGATGTGKTHTMLGTARDPGIMMLTLTDLYKKIEETKDEREYRVSVAYIELYNETIRDLLKEKGEDAVLDLREDSKGEVVISGLVDLETNSASHVMTLLSQGNQRRTSEPTAANKHSSRSHALLKLTIEQRSKAMNTTQVVKTGVLYMVDLAGSERARVTQNRGMRMIEGAHINRSLLALANCFNALSLNPHHAYINYRDSKLTRLLKDAIGGNCLTIMIAHISPSSTVFEESRNTLVYAERGKKIKNKTHQNTVDVNYHVTQYQNIIDTLNTRLEQLQQELDQKEPSHPQNAEVTTLCKQLKKYSQEEKEIRQEILTLEYHLLQNAVECQKHFASIKEWEQQRLSLSNLPASISAINLSSPTTEFEPTNQSCKQKSSSDRLESSAEEEQFSDTYVDSSESPSRSRSSCNDCSDPAYSRPTSATEHSMMEFSAKPLKPKPRLFLPALRPAMDELVTTPDSGMCTDVPEPLWVSAAREEVATLVSEKQRMEAQHCRLQKKHRENIGNMAVVKERISSYSGIDPLRKELIDILCHSCEIEAAAVEHSLAATMMSLQLGRYESLIDRLLAHSAMLMKTVTTLEASMSQRGVTIPDDVRTRSKELEDRQRELKAQVLAEKQIPLLSRKMQIPHLAKLSANLYTTMTGSKSNLLIDESETGKESVPLTEPTLSLSNVHLLSTHPSIQSPLGENTFPFSLSTTTLATVSQIIPSFLQLSSSSLVPEVKDSLPPLNLHKGALTASPLVTQEKRSSVEVAQPLADSSLVRIFEAARLKRSDTKTSIGSMKKQSMSPKRVLGRVTSFASTPKRPTSEFSTGKKAKYVVLKSISCANTTESQDSDSSHFALRKFPVKQKKLPMDRLVTVVKLRHKSESSVKESRPMVPRPTMPQKLKPMHKHSSLPSIASLKCKGSLSGRSLTLLQSNKKLSRVTRPKQHPHRKEYPISACKVAGKFVNSPYQSPLRTVIGKPQGSPKKSPLKKVIPPAWK